MARYTFRWDDNGVAAEPAGAASVEAVETGFHRFALPIMLQHRGLECLHASAVVIESGVVALCGFSGVGKSSCAAGLAHLGVRTWADDAVALIVGGDGVVTTVRLPFDTRLAAKARAMLGSLPGPDAGQEGRPGDLRPLVGLVLLSRGDDEALLLEDVKPSGAFTAVLEHAQFFSIAQLDARRRLSENHLALVEAVPAIRCRFPSSTDAFPKLIERLAVEIETRFSQEPAGGG